jgi:Spy/CpxP family protein refolding chaperone
MKNIQIFILSVLLFCFPAAIFAQDSGDMPERTPEQEAEKQTEKLQQELDLTPEQTRQVHEINLKYARRRQQSNSRTEAVERIKEKDNDLRKVLSSRQYEKLQSKRYERSRSENPSSGGQSRQQSGVSSGEVSTRRRTVRPRSAETTATPNSQTRQSSEKPTENAPRNVQKPANAPASLRQNSDDKQRAVPDSSKTSPPPRPAPSQNRK